MNLISTTANQNRFNKPLTDIKDDIQRLFAQSIITQVYSDETYNFKITVDQALNKVLDRIAAIEKEPYFKEDDVPSDVFRNAEMLAEELGEYIAFLDPDDIGTLPNGTATFRFETGEKTYFNLDIGRTTLAYVLSDQDSLFIPGEGKINQLTVKKINKLLKKYFIK